MSELARRSSDPVPADPMRPRSTTNPPLALFSTSSGTRVTVRVIPRAGRTAVAGVRGDALLCRLAAAPVDGAANDALITLLSQALGVNRHAVRIQSGGRANQGRRDRRFVGIRCAKPPGTPAGVEGLTAALALRDLLKHPAPTRAAEEVQEDRPNSTDGRAGTSVGHERA